MEQRTAELVASNVEMESFCYTISHDLRAPLRAIDGFIRILLEDHDDLLSDEARQLWSDLRGISPQARQAVGYAELFDFFERDRSPDFADERSRGAALDEAIERIKINSRRLAKQQRTWLRRIAGVAW